MLKAEWKEKGKYTLYFLLFLPQVAMALFFIFTHGSLNRAFLVPLAVTLCVGIGEEVMFRRILFHGLLKTMDFKKALLLSSIIFSLLHSVNVLAGLPFSQMLMQLLMTFLAGLYFALMYYYTKNIYLLIIGHWLWDYILLLGGAAQQIPVFGMIMSLMTFLQIAITILLLTSKKHRLA